MILIAIWILITIKATAPLLIKVYRLIITLLIPIAVSIIILKPLISFIKSKFPRLIYFLLKKKTSLRLSFFPRCF